MTTLIMLQKEDDVILGWDAASTNGAEQTELVQQKVWVQDGIIYGIAGMLRVADIIIGTDFPVFDGGDPRKWIIKRWVPVFREAAREAGGIWDDERGGIKNLELLIVVGGQGFDLDSVLCPTQGADGITALGSGGGYAVGALLSGATVIEALSVAAERDAFTGGTLTAKSAKAMIAEDWADNGQYRVTFERANNPSKRWGIVLDYNAIDQPDDFAVGFGQMVLATLKMDREFLDRKANPGVTQLPTVP